MTPIRLAVATALFWMSPAPSLLAQDPAPPLWNVQIEHTRLAIPDGYMFEPSARAAHDKAVEAHRRSSELIEEEARATLGQIDTWSAGAGFAPPGNREAWLKMTCVESPFTLAFAAQGASKSSDSLNLLFQNLTQNGGSLSDSHGIQIQRLQKQTVA